MEHDEGMDVILSPTTAHRYQDHTTIASEHPVGVALLFVAVLLFLYAAFLQRPGPIRIRPEEMRVAKEEKRDVERSDVVR